MNEHFILELFERELEALEAMELQSVHYPNYSFEDLPKDFLDAGLIDR